MNRMILSYFVSIEIVVAMLYDVQLCIPHPVREQYQSDSDKDSNANVYSVLNHNLISR